MLCFTARDPDCPVTDCCVVYPLCYVLQQEIQIALLLIAVLCIPVLLFVRPIYELCAHKAKVKVSG